jgi:large subunit ribosomal protein L28
MSRLSTQLSALSLTSSTRSSIPKPTSNLLRTTCIRSFSISAVHNRLHSKKQLYRDHKDVPEYPHGPAQLYKKSNFGLYGGARVRFGNIVSKGKWVKKTRRKWWPNVQEARLYSEGLKKTIELKVTTSVLRTIDKLGGLDNYLLGETSARIKDLGMRGWKLRWELMQQPSIMKQFAEERRKLGLTSEEIEEEVKQMEATTAEFKEQHARKSVEERAKAYQEKRRRKDVWRGQILPAYKEIVNETWNDLMKAPANLDVEDSEAIMGQKPHMIIKQKLEENPSLWQDAKDDIVFRLENSRA